MNIKIPVLETKENCHCQVCRGQVGWDCREEWGHGHVIEAITVARNCEYQNTCLRIKAQLSLPGM